jgi:hypothetical protein
MNFLEGFVDEKSRQVIIIAFQAIGHSFEILSAIILLVFFLNKKTESKFKDFCINAWIAFVESPFKDLPKYLIANIFRVKSYFNIFLLILFKNFFASLLFFILFPIMIGLGSGYFFGIDKGIYAYLFASLIYLVKIKKIPTILLALLSLSISSVVFFYLWFKAVTTFNIIPGALICFFLFPFASLLYLQLHSAGIVGNISRLIGFLGIYILTTVQMLLGLISYVILTPIFFLLSPLIVITVKYLKANDVLNKKLSLLKKFCLNFSKYLTYSLHSVFLYFFSKSRGYPFIIKPEDDEETIQDKAYLAATPIASLKGINDHMDRLLSPFLVAIILPSSLLLTLSALAVGYYVEPGVIFTVSTRLLIINFLFDLLTVYTTVLLLYWLLTHYNLKRTLKVIILDLLLSAILGCMSLYFIYWGTPNKLGLYEILNILIGKSLDGSVYIFGSYFWLMHTTFIPTATIMFLLFVTYLAHYLHIPFEKIFFKVGAFEKPLYFCSVLALLVGAICSGIGWLV